MSEERTRGGKIIPDLSGAHWQKAGDDARGSVEVAFVDGMIAMRDSKDPDGPALIFTQGEWDAFVGGVHDGEFDLN